MKRFKLIGVAALLIAFSPCYIGTLALAADAWKEDTFPPPNGGRLVFTITSDGNPACASYDAANCLWGQTMRDVDFSRVKPLVCGAAHRKLYGVTGFEDPNHWCNLALRERPAQTAPAALPPPAAVTPPPPPAGGYRMTDWSGWARAAGVQYRYRVGWDPARSGAGNTVDAIYEVRNPAAQRWSGAARSVNCAQNTLAGSADVALAPGQTKEVRVRAPNCGNAGSPNIRPDVIRAGRFD
jgi:hypothetical protein